MAEFEPTLQGQCWAVSCIAVPERVDGEYADRLSSWSGVEYGVVHAPEDQSPGANPGRPLGMTAP